MDGRETGVELEDKSSAEPVDDLEAARATDSIKKSRTAPRSARVSVNDNSSKAVGSQSHKRSIHSPSAVMFSCSKEPPPGTLTIVKGSPTLIKSRYFGSRRRISVIFPRCHLIGCSSVTVFPAMLL
ncbi:MAG: hypothetical protein WBZ54_04930, partial [Methylocella sp.]